jgi:hypothetical protein
MTRTHSLPCERWGENGPPQGKRGPRLGKCRSRLGAVMSGGSMTANHVEHEIATFPGSLGRAGGR